MVSAGGFGRPKQYKNLRFKGKLAQKNRLKSPAAKSCAERPKAKPPLKQKPSPKAKPNPKQKPNLKQTPKTNSRA